MRESNLIALIDDHGIRYLKTDDGFVAKFRGSIFVYKGGVNTFADLANVEDPEVGDVYHIITTNEEYYYSDASTWEYFGVSVDISGKLDKVTSSASGSRIYGVSPDGTQTMYDLSDEASGNTVPLRGTNGVLSVGTPVEEYHAAPKGYVDTEMSKIPAKTGTTDPTTSTVGYLGQFYFNTANNSLFQCTGISGSTYTWTKQETPTVEEPALILDIKTTSAAQELAFDSTRLSGTPSSGAAFSIDWGDGTKGTSTSHTYTNAGSYECKIYGISRIENGSSAASFISQASRLIYVTTGHDLTYIGQYAFYGCTNLKEAYLDDHVEDMGGSVFSGCTSLVYCKMPQDIRNEVYNTHLGTHIFFGCTGLRGVEWPPYATSIPTHTFYNCSLRSFNFSNIYEIGKMAFYGCAHLSEINLHSTNIGIQAFDGCFFVNRIQFIVKPPYNVPSANAGVFDNMGDCPIYVPFELLSAFKTSYSAYASRIHAFVPEYAIPSWHAIDPADQSGFTMNADAYKTLTLMYYGNGGTSDDFSTSTIIIGPRMNASICGTMDDAGKCPTAYVDYSDDHYIATISPPTNCYFVGYFQ